MPLCLVTHMLVVTDAISWQSGSAAAGMLSHCKHVCCWQSLQEPIIADNTVNILVETALHLTVVNEAVLMKPYVDHKHEASLTCMTHSSWLP